MCLCAILTFLFAIAFNMGIARLYMYLGEAIGMLAGCEAHSTVILSQVDQDVYRKLGINLTCEPRYQTKKLYHK